ncbi:MAG TPA: beta-ketoacyl-ACP synthase III [Cyclobacteriaceae bacterium]|nr:beta-ketoacyl-ACP synthase III [Cyclobacteriaceae bacterium]
MRKSKITGVGHYVPERIVTNFDLEKLMDTSNEWIVERTGINERRFFNPEKDTNASMAAEASRKALAMAGLTPSAIDVIVYATISPDYMFPGSGVLMQRELGMEGIPAIDIRNACSGFIYGLSIADQYIKTGMYNNALVIGSEIQSSGLDLTSRGRAVSVIFGDGAGAVVLQPSENPDQGILSTHLHADGKFAEELFVRDPGSSRKVRMYRELMDGDTIYGYMNGNLVFKHAIVRFIEVIMESLKFNHHVKDDIDLLIPHQANLRISAFIEEKLGLKGKVYHNIMRYGNTTAASIPIAMSEACAEGKISEGKLICLAAFGSGFTWASTLIKW